MVAGHCSYGPRGKMEYGRQIDLEIGKLGRILFKYSNARRGAQG